MDVIIVGGSFAEVRAFRAQEALPSRCHVPTREMLKGHRPSKIHLLPDFFHRRDGHRLVCLGL